MANGDALKTVGLIINPTAAKGNGRLVGEQVTDELAKHNVAVVNLSGSDESAAVAAATRAIKQGDIDALLVVGGDGVVHLGVNLCAGTDLPLGIVACGTGNDIATTLGLPINDAAAAVSQAIAKLDSPRRIDAGKANSSTGQFWFIGTVSAGFDALVNRRANRMTWPKGQRRYELAMLLELASFKPIRYEAVVDGEPRVIEAMLCAVANAPCFGGGMMIAPEAKIDDGWLDLFIVHKISRPELIRIFPKVYTGAHVSHPAVEIIRAKSITLDSGLMPAFSDGEAVGHSPISVTVEPGALLVLA
jgi:diacylglycerol kinase (ATP)